MLPSNLAKRGAFLLFLAIIAVYLYGLGQLPLIGPDEPRYAQIAREMLLRGDLITPTLGGHLWFEKPALLYWMMMGSFKLFGVSEWSARLPSALSGVLTIAAVFYVARSVERLSNDSAIRGWSFWTAVAAASSWGLIVFSRAATFDIVLTMTLAWALAFFVVSQIGPDPKRRRLLLAGFYVFIGLSLLAKGFIGLVIPIGVAGLYYLILRQWPEGQTFRSLFWGIPLAVAVAAIWYAPVTWRHGWPFINEFILQHQFARYVSNNYRHPGPFYYYFGVLLLFSLPWTMFVVTGLVKSKVWRTLKDGGQGDPTRRVVVFAHAWLLMPLIFFSFSRAKLPGYILPVLPALALIAGAHLTRFAANGSRGATLKIVVGMVIGVASIIFTLVLLHYFAPLYAERESSRRLLQLADAKGYSQTAIYGLQPDDRTPEFYAAGRVVYRDDGEPEMYIGPPQLVNETHRRDEVLLAFVPLPDAGTLQTAHAAITDVIGDNGRFALVAVRPKK